ncbi:nucleotide exchange factor GrpE [Candidatus Microgenomates bacterium]|nr:nucleotide exchange factor GrpE [Candidatus Microgenomates bacterium]
MGKQKGSDKNEKITEERVEFEEKWKRALADYQNLEKRAKEEKEKLIKSAAGEIVLKILPCLDDFERAAEHLKDEGLNLALRHLYQVLEKEGLSKIETSGRIFDPAEMEAIEIVPGEEENKVVKEFRAGYKLNNQVIRHAQVNVGKKKVEEKAEELALDQLQKGDYI